MKIHSLSLKNFKRFTDLRIENIPSTSKLVLLIGSNGSGKSSIFDAFGWVDATLKGYDLGNFEERDAHFKKDKNNNIDIKINLDKNKKIETEHLATNLHTFPKNSFYGRTSFRQTPRLTRTTLGGNPFNFEKDSDRSRFFIDKDERFENDIEKITETIMKEVFRSTTSNEEIKKRYIEPLNKSLSTIFGTQNGTKLELIEIIPPLEGKVAQINFRKGESEFHYNQLSAGEKEVINLLINLISRVSLYQDTIYFFDELDVHLNTKIQYNLLKEITENWIPASSQLWTATHSLGFIEYAQKSDLATLIDFNDLDFDLPQTLFPAIKENPEIYEIAVGKEFLSSLFRNINVFFVENKDVNYYAKTGVEDSVFIAASNRNDVYNKIKSSDFYGIVDRDFLSDQDIALIKDNYSNLFILSYYSIENYLYHPDNLEEYYKNKNLSFDKTTYIEELKEEKNNVYKRISLRIASERTSYPYFKESEFTNRKDKIHELFKNSNQNFAQTEIISTYLESDDFETFYKVLPMKDYCKQIPARQNISKIELSTTKWFKEQIKNIIL